MNDVRGLFWAIAMRHHTAFLLGSIHCMREDMYPLPTAMEQAFSRSSTIAFEADREETRTPAFKRYVQARRTYPPGETLWKNISSSTQHQLRKTFSRLQFSVHVAETIRPWLLSTMLKEPPQDGDDTTLHHALGLDTYFFNKAQQEQKRVMFLESATAQVDCLATLPARQQEFLLQDALREEPLEGEIPLDDVLELWNAGEADALEAQYRQHHTDQMTIYEQIVIHRNHRWIPIIEDLLQLGENVMIVVGGGHVGGPDGLVRLLADKGYPIVQK